MFINKNELTQGLRSKDFIDEVFESFQIIPTTGSTVKIENCHFQRSKVLSGNAVLRKGVALKVEADKSEAGLFSLPPKSGKNYESSMKELDILRENGFYDIS